MHAQILEHTEYVTGEFDAETVLNHRTSFCEIVTTIFLFHTTAQKPKIQD